MNRRIFLDFDNTICNSSQAFCRSYNYLYKDKPNFKLADWTKVEVYNFKDQCPLVENVNIIFESDEFWNSIDFINSNTYEILEKLNEYYEIIICSIGTPKNLARKSLWINKNLPFVNNYVLLNNGTNIMDKSIVDMSNSIIVDDVTKNLDSSNAKVKIIFGDEYEWSKTDRYKRCYNFTDVYNFLNIE